EMPFIRSQNITGTIYFDRNMNGEQDPNEAELSGIPIRLINKDQKAELQTYTNQDGQFIFYQLAPGLYQFGFDDNLLPDNMQAPGDIGAITVDSGNLDEFSPIKIGLIPFERPINIVKEETKLLLSLDQELVKPGAILELTIESVLTLKSLELILPTGETIQLETASNHIWKYRWQVPQNIPSGQVKVRCIGNDLEGMTHQEEALLVIIP
ncbi:MAG: SdrD B-like domain-containing protein, partial [Bacteroidota bacterium]